MPGKVLYYWVYQINHYQIQRSMMLIYIYNYTNLNKQHHVKQTESKNILIYTDSDWGLHQSKCLSTPSFDISEMQTSCCLILVGGIPTPLKNMSSSVGMMTFPIYGKIKIKCSKPPTSIEIW